MPIFKVANAAEPAEIRRALSVLMDPSQSFELRGVPSGRSRICRGNDLDSAVEAACELSDDPHVFYLLNPVRPDLDRSARKADIVARRWLLVDVDTVRPIPEAPSSEAERAKSFEVAGRIMDGLLALGWPLPVIVDSGNGWHLLYRIDLPADDLSRQLCKGVLARLASDYDDSHGKIDTKVHDAPRPARLPGTWSRKGISSPERPHRLAKLVMAFEPVEVVTAEQLNALVAGGRAPVAPPFPSTSTSNGTTNGKGPRFPIGPGHALDRYVARAVELECFRIEKTPEGDRNNVLNDASFRLATMSIWPEMDVVGTHKALCESARRAGLDETESRKTIGSGWAAGVLHPRLRPIEPGKNGTAGSHGTDGAKPRLIIWAKDIQPRKVEWLMPKRIPIGKMTTFAGQTGMGKTFALCDLAARVTRGAEIPFGGGECFRQGKVLIISAEDDADDTIVPRFMEMDGDRSRLAVLSPEAEDQFSLSALELLNDSLDQMGEDVRLVAIDPPTSYLGKVDDHRNAELRGLLAPLRRWAIQRRIVLLLITHINKAGGQKVEAMARVMGSAAWVQAVRAAHMFCPDPNTKGQSLFIPLKVNNAEKPRGLSYRIVGTGDDLAILEWIAEVDTTADEAMHQQERQPLVRSAREVLIEMFSQQMEWQSDQFWMTINANGIKRTNFDKARAELGIPRTRQTIGANGDRVHTWWVPPNWPHFQETENKSDK